MSGHRNSRVTPSSSSNEASNEGTSSTSKRSKVEFKVNSAVRVGAAASAFQPSGSTKSAKPPATSSHSENVWTVVDANDVSGGDDDDTPPVFSVTDSTMPGEVDRRITRSSTGNNRKSSHDGGRYLDKRRRSKDKDTRRSSRDRTASESNKSKQMAKPSESAKDLNSSASRPSSSVGGRSSQLDQAHNKSNTSSPRNESSSGKSKKASEGKKHQKSKGGSRSRSRSPRDSKKARKASPMPASKQGSQRKRSRDRDRSRSPVVEGSKKAKPTAEKAYSSKRRSRSRDASITPVESEPKRHGRSRSKESKAASSRRSVSKERQKVEPAAVISSSISVTAVESFKMKKEEIQATKCSVSVENTAGPARRGKTEATRERERSREDSRGGRDRGRGPPPESRRNRDVGSRGLGGRYTSESGGGGNFSGSRSGYSRKGDESPSAQRRPRQSESSTQMEGEGGSKRRSKRDSVTGDKKSDKKKEKGSLSPSTAVRRLKDASDDELDAKLAKMEKRGALLAPSSVEPSSHDVDWTSFAQELAGLQSHHKTTSLSPNGNVVATSGVDVISAVGVASTLLSKPSVEKLFEAIRDASGLQQLNPLAAFHSIEFAKRKQQMETVRSRSSRSSGSLPPVCSAVTTSVPNAAPSDSTTSSQRKQAADALRVVMSSWSSTSVASQ